MALLKKVDSTWSPKEFPNVQVDEIIDFPGPFEELVRKGTAILVDKDGNELELPGQKFECPVCFEKVSGLQNFTEHVSKHMPKPKETPVEEKKEEPKADDAKQAALRANRLANLEKARQARMAKKEAQNDKVE